MPQKLRSRAPWGGPIGGGKPRGGFRREKEPYPGTAFGSLLSLPACVTGPACGPTTCRRRGEKSCRDLDDRKAGAPCATASVRNAEKAPGERYRSLPPWGSSTPNMATVSRSIASAELFGRRQQAVHEKAPHGPRYEFIFLEPYSMPLIVGGHLTLLPGSCFGFTVYQGLPRPSLRSHGRRRAGRFAALRLSSEVMFDGQFEAGHHPARQLRRAQDSV